MLILFRKKKRVENLVTTQTVGSYPLYSLWLIPRMTMSFSVSHITDYTLPLNLNTVKNFIAEIVGIYRESARLFSRFIVNFILIIILD